MRKNDLLNLLLAVVVGLACLAVLLCRVFLPAAVLPVVSLPAIAALILLSLVLESYLTREIPRRNWGMATLLAVLTFGLLPFGAGIVAVGEAVRLAAVGGAVFLVLTFLFTQLRERLVSGRAGVLAPLVTGGVLFLACQCLMGMIW